MPLHQIRPGARGVGGWIALVVCLALASPASAVILWSDLGATLVHHTGLGTDILGAATRRDDLATDTLYFKFHVDPLSDARTEEYLAAFQLFQKGRVGLGIGNSQKAWAYSAFNTAAIGEFNKVSGDIDLNSARPESSGVETFYTYELPRRGVECTVVVKVHYIRAGDDEVTVWLNPDLNPGATEDNQQALLMTKFMADASFDEIHLRHEGGGGGWIFSDMAVATSFRDFVNPGNSGLAASGAETNKEPGSVAFRAWTRDAGLPQNAVRALAQTPDGYIWVGTDEGIARFDGVRFVTFSAREGLHGERVRTLLADSRGALWIGTTGDGLTRLENGQFTTYTTKEGLPGNTINALAEDGEGRLWVGTEAGLVVWKDGHEIPVGGVSNFKGAPVNALFKDRKGAMWLGIGGVGVFQWKGGTLERLVDATLEGLLREPHCLLVDQARRVWIGAGDDYVLCREGEEWRRYRIPRRLARPYVSALAEEPDGTVWAGSVSEGLFRFQEGRLTAINSSSGLSESTVASLLVDHTGGLWVGTGAGLNRMQRKMLSAYGQNEGLGYGPVQGLAEVAPGVIWAAKPEEGLFQWSAQSGSGKPFMRLALTNVGVRNPQVSALLVTRDGSCLLASEAGLLRAATPAEASDDLKTELLVTNTFTALAQDASEDLWAGTRTGEIWQSRKGSWSLRATLPGHQPITGLVPDSHGTIWIGSDGGGLNRVSLNGTLMLTKSQGLLSEAVRTLMLDRQGALWVGTARGGLRCLRDGRLQTFSTHDGLPDNTISQILEDDDGRLWLGNNRGIACVQESELEAVGSGKQPLLYPQIYNRESGMLSEECTGGYFPAALRTKSGLLCFATTKGIVTLNPKLKATRPAPPPVIIEEMLVDAEPPSTRAWAESPAAARGPGLRIPSGRHRVEFHFTGLNFDEPELVRFRFRLDGLDEQWIDAGPKRTAPYTYLPPGTYRFHVAACTAGGDWSDAQSSAEFVVAPPFWQTGWFIALTVLASIGLVVLIVRFVEKQKLQQRLKQIEQERTIERERNRIAQDLHDDLGSSLARISLLSGLAREDKENPKQVLTHVTKIAQSADETVRALEEIVWAVRPGSDSLQSLVEYIAHFSNELFERNGTRCRLDLPHDLPTIPLPPEMRHNIFLVVKEALTNVLKHAGAKEVHMQAKASDRTMEFVIQDNGRGFDPSRAAQDGKRNGLVNMRRRAEAMGGTLTVQTARAGTTVRLVVTVPATGRAQKS